MREGLPGGIRAAAELDHGDRPAAELGSTTRTPEIAAAAALAGIDRRGQARAGEARWTL